MRYLPSRVVTPSLACAIALLLLMPSFSVAAPRSPAGAPPQIPSAAAQVPPSSTPSALSSYKSIGAADPNMSVLVSVAIPLRNLPLLSSLVKESSDPNSAGFRHFLTHSQVSQTFLPTQGQYQSVLDYLTSKGFTVESSALNSMISVRGTVAQVNQYLGQGVQLYSNGTYSYYQTTGQTTLSGAYSFASNSSGLLMRPDLVKAGAASRAAPSANVTFTQGGQETKLLQSVYNSTGLLSKGINGTGYTIGLLDFYGYAAAARDLALYDSTYGYPAPPSFTVSPIGPYNPNLGSALGWDGEIDLDVQTSHAMAPGANIILYAGNGALPLSAVIAQIVQDGKANVVSQSFGLAEWQYYETGPSNYLFNSVFTDDYYMLGSAMGMTFLASSGDGGGSGFSAGPEGGAEYPSTSPFVTALGGTSTYISTTASGAMSLNQTAWSSIGFVPYFVNQGGSGGGVSILEPTPWYQSSLQVPPSFPNGRMVPDVSLDASASPGTFIIYRGSPIVTGGTSESSPLFAGLLALLMGAQKASLGLLNPAIYQLAGNSSTYQKAFTPVTFGYTIPWVSKFGYNLATGWGVPNIGEIAALYGTVGSPSSALSVNVNLGLSNVGSNISDYTPGKTIDVRASITSSGGQPVTTGSFTANLQTLAGSATPVPLTFNATQGAWAGTLSVGSQAGIAYVNVAGSSGGQSGEGFATTFVGYLANFVQPLAPYPWTFLPRLETSISITDLYGNNAPFTSTTVTFEGYSILSNTYTQAASAALVYSQASGYFQAALNESLPDGPTALITQGSVVGYLPFVSGISLLGSYIYPQVVAEPGSVAPGQSLTIVATATAPENIYQTLSLATGVSLGASIAEGANVTATLVSSTGQSVATVSLTEQPCAQALRVCGAGLTLINGYLTIPANASAGLYTVVLKAVYNDETTGFNYGGSYFGQVYVAPGFSVPKISVGPATLFEGENALITASITNPDGKEVTNGLYTALVYPGSAQDDYSSLMHSTYAASALIPLTFDAKIGMWTATATMPSPYNSSLVSFSNANAEYYGGPYDVYVSGLSAGGVPTAATLSAQQGFYVQPYVYTANQVMTDPQQTSRLALSNVTINAGTKALSLADDYFVGNNTVTGSDVTITSSTVNGTLNLENGQTTLDGVSGGNVVATNAKVILQHTALASLNLGVGATASIDSASSYQSINPALPVITISSPTPNASYTGSFNAQVAVTGSGIAALTFMLDGKALPPFQGSNIGPQISYPLNTTSMPDGTHTLTVTAVQSDLLTISASVSFVTHNQLAALTNGLATANKTIGSLNGNLSAADSNISTLRGDLSSANHTIDNLSYLAYVAVAIGLVGIILAAYAVRGPKAPWKY
ncbi:MAG TPA: protease pro-enzyme activation domain-containing protein [Nitrososphaerales archaeon]|nr:protease pro-enzyme activation domain-containing protein [Nitrososphaerales archaeon]